MAWAPKASAPATFNLADAFLALITGDPTWGWLVDWLPFVTNDHFDTAAFCAGGPIAAPDLSVALGPSPPDRSPLAVAAKIATIGAGLVLTARERVFGAYCEQRVADGAGWTDEACTTVSSAAGDHVEIEVAAPATATRVRMRFSAISDQTIAGTQFAWSLVNPGQMGTFSEFRWQYGSPPIGLEGNNSEVALNGWTGLWLQAIGNMSVTFCYQFNGADSVVTYVPTAQPEPAGLLSPLRAVDPSLDGIAHEAELLELKLDTLLSIVQAVAGSTLDLGGPAGDPTDVTPDAPIEVGDAVGCVLTASGIPASRSLDFGTPQNVVKLGHVNFGTADGWYPSIWMTHTPMVVRPFPPGTLNVTVTDLPPGVSVQIRLLARNK